MATDYKALGFRCGLEIHQQIAGKKLFCDCPSINSKASPDIRVVRSLRASAGETGEVDIAAKHEMSKSKYFIYEGNSEDTCLVELDEEPPHALNQDALHVGLIIAKLLKATVVDEIQFMRKTVVDGSNTSGFQRTALIAQNGYLETSKGRVGIPTICLEEEAAQKAEESKEYVRYKLDRLGITLLEIATDPTLQDAEHAKEAAEQIGMILRSTGKVLRGIGTIRQDVNLSIKGHPRVEIKGFQDLRSIPKTIENEIQRQLKEKKADPHVRKANPDFSTSFLRPMPGAARMYVETDIPTLPISKKRLSELVLPQLLSEKADTLKQAGIDKELAAKIAKTGKTEFFTSLFKELKNLKPSFMVDAFQSLPKELEKEHKITPTEEQIRKILTHVNNQDIPKSAVSDALVDLSKGKLDLAKFKSASTEDVEKEIQKIVKEKPGLSTGAYMGLIMAKFKGNIDGKEAAKILKKLHP